MPPPLIGFAGQPGAGKTTLATKLAAELHLPLLTRDSIKEALADEFGVETIAESQRLGAAAFRALYRVLDQMLPAGCGAVVEANFGKGMAETELQPFVQRTSAALVHCQTTRAIAMQRYAERVGSPGRHWSHLDAERVKLLESPEVAGSWDRAGPMDLGVPTLIVDTTDGYVPSFAEIEAFCRKCMP